MKSRKQFLTVMIWLSATMAAAAPKPVKQVYVPMDYSTCGYRASEQGIPDVPNAVYVAAAGGDQWERIQRAIDYVATLKPDAEGRRGAVLLGEGRFLLTQPLRIAASGIVVRGMGKGKTVLVKQGVERGAAVYVEGTRSEERGAGSEKRGMRSEERGAWSANVADDFVPAGSTAFSLSSTQGLNVGDRILITRPCTAEWILSLRMNDFGGGLDYTGWKPTDVEITWNRTITAIDGARVTVDAPLTTAIRQAFGGATVVKGGSEGEISECGIENLSIESEVNSWNPKDEDHCWDAICLDNVRDGWVRRVDFCHFAGSAVNIQKGCSRITVEDCLAHHPVSEIGGWRRCVFLTRGQQTLIQRCVSRQGIHDFAAGACAAGPNAFVQCEGEQSLGFSGSIGSWAAGLLFDIVNIDGNDIRLANLEQFQTGTGWNSANSMLWQCTASTIWCYSPDDDNRSSGHGCWGTLTGNAEWTSSNDHVQPRSLFYEQLSQRVKSEDSSVKSEELRVKSEELRVKSYDNHQAAPVSPKGNHNSSPITHHSSPKSNHNSSPFTLHPISPYLLPRPTDATSSPTVEQAMAMARESMTQPRLTMEMWMDSIPYTAPLSTKGVRRIDDIKAAKSKPAAVEKPDFGITDGHITADGRLIVGNRYDIPWWNGRVKDNFVNGSAKPAITRFVPGREGTGWTDRIDSVVNYMKRHACCMLDHHYGLWYDLRRIDHERVRRATPEVEAPFYEQPFARSGQGTANEGLSRYDLTKPNLWYWHRLNQFAQAGAPHGMLLYCQHYFQHNILEAGAHWVDCPWRAVNNVNSTPFPEPVPFAGDKRIFMAEQFYDVSNDHLRQLHRQYIRQCLEQLREQPNAVHVISAEYTGPLHFTRFWLQTIAEWEAETGRHPLVALSCTKDAQDSVLSDPELSKVVDIIDIRYWHYNTRELWAPAAGKNMAPRQWMRKWQVGKTGFDEAYRAVSEYRRQYPDKAVTFFAQQYPSYGWAILMAGGSLPNLPISDRQLLADLSHMQPVSGSGCLALADAARGYLVYVQQEGATLEIAPGRYRIAQVDRSGRVQERTSAANLQHVFSPEGAKAGAVYWLRRI